MMPRKDIPVGTRFGNLVVVGKAPPVRMGVNGILHSASFVKCDCGKSCIVINYRLRKGRVKSCGCLEKGHMKKHGASRSRLYATWKNMKQRCENPNASQYEYYGGRGIKVCDDWANSFEVFMKWAIASGYNDSLTIDRVDGNGNYCPANCRWISMRAQMLNRRNCFMITAFGKTLPLACWAREVGIDRSTIRARITQLGWTPEKALSVKQQTKGTKQCT